MARKTQYVQHVRGSKAGRTASGGQMQGIYRSKMVLRGPSELVELVTHGVPVADAKKLTRHFKVSESDVIWFVGGKPATFRNPAGAGRLSPGRSERLVRLARLMAAAKGLHEGDAEAARRWMVSPKTALGGATPLAYARTEVGAREVEDLIGRLEHGVFS